MALVLKDRVQETGTANTTVSFTLAGAVVGFQTFAAIGNSNVTFYTATDATGNWEVGVGTYSTTGPTLTRDSILSSSNSGSAVTFSGTVNVFVTYPAEQSVNYDVDGVATIGSPLGYSDTGIVASFASTVAGYNQVVVQNKSTATNASTNFNVSNDAGTAGNNYAELGINSSTFTGTGSFNIAGASYVASASTDLTIGTYGAYNIHFVTNSSTTDAMTIYNDGGVSLGTFSNPGMNNIAASKFVPGYTGVTSAGGTTVLTDDSNYYQNLLGSTTQTFQLPDATTLLIGTTFIFDNDATGVLTVVDNASGAIETVPSGASGFVYLANNSTVAGTWRRHAFLPASYDFNAATANFGTATITNATWNGNTIPTGYGGTGLTTFSAANNAIYSTGASTLTAGTLPVLAGGTGVTTSTGTGNVVLSSGPTLVSPSLQAYGEKVETIGTIATSTYNIDLSLANIFDLTLGTDVTVTFTNPPAAGTTRPVTLIVRQPAASPGKTLTVTGAQYTDGTAPILSTGANQKDVLSYWSIDGGTIYFGTYAMANVS